MRKLWSFAVCVLLVSFVRAQRFERVLDTYSDGVFIGYNGDVEWSIDDVGELLRVSSSSNLIAGATTSVSVPGAMHVLSDDEVLIGGRASGGAGLVEHWRFSGAALVISSSTTLPGADVAGVAYSEIGDTLYVLDSINSLVLRGAWDGSGPLSGVAFIPWVDQNTIPGLSSAGQRFLAMGADGVTPTLRLFHWPFTRNQVAVTLTDSWGGAVVGSWWLDPGAPPKDVFVDDVSVTENATTVDVFAPNGVAFEFVDADADVVLGSGIGGPAGEITLAISSPLALGRRYAARRTGQTVAPEEGATCVVRYGHPEVFSDGTAIDQVHYQLGAQVGSEFWMEVGMRNDSIPANDLTYTGYMFIGFRIGGVDPTTPYGNNVLLVTSTYFPAIGFLSSANGWGLTFSAFVIPDDPGLIGLTFLTQFVMEDGQDYRLSEIYGAYVEGAVAGAQSGSGGVDPGTLAAEYLSRALLEGRVRDARPVLLQVLPRR